MQTGGVAKGDLGILHKYVRHAQRDYRGVTASGLPHLLDVQWGPLGSLKQRRVLCSYGNYLGLVPLLE